MRRTIKLIIKDSDEKEEQKILNRINVMMRECFPLVDYDLQAHGKVVCSRCWNIITVPENWMKFDIGCSKCGSEVKV